MDLQFVYDFDATKAALLYLASKRLPEFDKHKAGKLLFLADREHLLRFGRTITGDSYVPGLSGPVPSPTLPTVENELANLDALSESDIMVLDHVAAEHGNRTFQELKDLTQDMAVRFEDFFAESPEKAELLAEILENQFLSVLFEAALCDTEC